MATLGPRLTAAAMAYSLASLLVGDGVLSAETLGEKKFKTLCSTLCVVCILGKAGEGTCPGTGMEQTSGGSRWECSCYRRVAGSTELS